VLHQAEASIAAAGADRDTHLTQRAQDLEQAYRRAIATVEAAGSDPGLDSIEDYDEVAGRCRDEMDKLRAEFEDFVAKNPETQDPRNHRDVWMGVQRSKFLNRPRDDRWFQMERNKVLGRIEDRHFHEQCERETQERNEAWRTTTMLRGDRRRIHEENGRPHYWEGYFESKGMGMPDSAVRADAWTYYNSWSLVPGGGMQLDVTIYSFDGDKLVRIEKKTNHSS